MTKNFRFEGLDCWHHARKLTNLIFQTTHVDEFNKSTWLIEHLQKTALSVMSIIAEGACWNSSEEFIHFLEISRSALIELHNYICIALDLGYIDEEGFKKISVQSQTTGKIISGMIKYLKNRSETPTSDISPDN